MLHLFNFNEAHLKFPLLKFMEFLPIREYKKMKTQITEVMKDWEKPG